MSDDCKCPVFDGDILALRSWINQESIIPPSGQTKLRKCVDQVLHKLAGAHVEVVRLKSRVWEIRNRYSEEVFHPLSTSLDAVTACLIRQVCDEILNTGENS